jgi:hypothetical protein
MKTLNKAPLVLISALCAAANSAYGQQPPDVVMSDASFNTAMGTSALMHLSTGTYNTAAGDDALLSNTIGYDNTATGALALGSNQSGYQNSAYGASALQGNTTGINNTATGVFALYTNDGSNNTASGYGALFSNSSGQGNTAAGMSALQSNTTGNYNMASGYEALYRNTSGAQNTAAGVNALRSNTSGDYNTALGTDALYDNTRGSYNIAQGYKAGFSLTTGSDNIDIGNQGMAGESGTIRIGTKSTQGATYIAGIYGTSITGSAVMVSSDGQLGVTVSSERFKTAITPMGGSSQKLRRLRPVTFHLKTDPNGALQYGLIAEEVAKVYPELVIRSETGRIDGVRYDEIAPLLLNEVQRQQAMMAAQAKKIASLGEQLAAQAAEVHELKEQQAQFATRE